MARRVVVARTYAIQISIHWHGMGTFGYVVPYCIHFSVSPTAIPRTMNSAGGG
jgi:hypothetical protein